MRRLGNRVILAALAICLVLGGAVWVWYENQKVCCAFPDEMEQRRLGLMTSLPLYWPLGANVAAIASGNAPVPWQRQAMERRFELVPLDTLSPIPALTPDEPETDPLAELDAVLRSPHTEYGDTELTKPALLEWRECLRQTCIRDTVRYSCPPYSWPS